MNRPTDLVGARFGKLLVREYAGKNPKSYHRMWLCECDCRNQKVIREDGLTDGRVMSCGCLRPGYSKTRLYRIWAKMKERCLNPNSQAFKHYGGRGITICDRWLSFEGFLGDMGPTYKGGLTIDRIDNDKGYSKDNCRWVNHKRQCRNRRSNHLVTYKGETLPMIVMAEKHNVDYRLLRNRIYKGWSIERAITQPKRGEKHASNTGR